MDKNGEVPVYRTTGWLDVAREEWVKAVVKYSMPDPEPTDLQDIRWIVENHLRETYQQHLTPQTLAVLLGALDAAQRLRNEG